MADDDKAQIEAMRLMVGGALQQMGRDIENLSKKAKDASSQGSGLTNLNSLFTGMTQNLIGPQGLAVAITATAFAAARSVEKFALSRIQLQNFSTDVGASVPLLNAMTAAMGRAGISAEDSQRSISTLGGLMKDLAARGMGSELATLLRETGRPVNDIEKLIQTAKTNMDQAIKDTIAILNTGNAQVRSYRAREIGIAESHLQGMKHIQEEMNKVYVADLKAAQKWHDDWGTIAMGVSNTWSKMFDSFLKSYSKIPRDKMDQLLGQAEKGFEPNSKSILGRTMSGDWSGSSFVYPQGEDPMGRDYTQGNETAGPRRIRWQGGSSGATDFSGRRRTDELMEVERGSNKTLLDIRDILQRMEGGGGGGGGGGGATYGTGARGGALQAGLGGFRGLTSSGHGGGFRPGRGGAGEPGPSIGNLQGLKGSDFLQSQRASRIDEINRDPELKENVLKMLQLEEGSVTGKTGAMEALLNRSIMTGNSVKSELFSGFYGPINRGGLSRSLGAAARRTSQSAFDNAAGGSDLIQSRTDQGMVGDPNASGPGRIRVPGTTGIFNFWKGRRMGRNFSHADSAAWAAEQERQILAGGDAQSARDNIDKAQSITVRPSDANMNATVDFKNMPSWVKSSVDSNGKFKELKVTRSTPQAGKASSPQGELQNWSYE